MRFRKIAAALLTLALGFCLCQPAAFAATAADQHTQLQELPVSIQSTGETPLPKETLTVELEAVDNAPLPEVTTLEITDGETGTLIMGLDTLLRISSNPFYAYVAERIGETLPPP